MTNNPLVSSSDASMELEDPQVITAWLIDEADRVGDRIADLLKADERFLSIGFTLIATAASVAVANEKAYFLMAVPFAFSLLFCFIGYQHHHLMGLGGYKSVIEQAIYLRTGVPVLAWELAIAPTLHRSPAVLAVRMLAVTFWIASIIGAVLQALATRDAGSWGHAHSTLYVGLTIASIVVGAVGAFVGEYTAKLEVSRVRKLAQETLLRAWATSAPAVPLDLKPPDVPPAPEPPTSS